MINPANDSARQFFKDSELTYKDIKYSDFLLLYWAIQRAFEKHNKRQKRKPKNERNYTMKVAKNPQYIKAKTGMKKGFIKVICDNYSTREAISFNEDGFIGFAGWADSENTRPIIRAFQYWCMSIRYQKQITKYGKDRRINLRERLTPKIIKNGMRYCEDINEVTNNE